MNYDIIYHLFEFLSFFHFYFFKYNICDMIKGNESDVGNIDFEL